MLEVKLESQSNSWLILLAVLLGLGSLAAYIPLLFCRLLIPIGFKIIDIKGLKHLLRVPRADAVLILVLVITTFEPDPSSWSWCCTSIYLIYEKASDLKKGIIIESVENLKDENRGKMNYLSMKSIKIKC
jgi:SulP family sulfate permease